MSRIRFSYNILILILCVSGSTFGADKPDSTLSKGLFPYLQIGEDFIDLNTINEINKSYDDLIHSLKRSQKRYSSEKNLMRLVFNKVHQRLLSNYVQYSSFSDLFTRGAYDCLTATTLYSIILNDLGIDYQIWVTNYHIYLKVYADGELILLETTDPIDGFVTGDDIWVRENEMKEDNKQGDDPLGSYLDIFREVSLTELRGLLYYNQATKKFNDRNYLVALDLIQNAQRYYSSERIMIMKNLIEQNVYLGSGSR